MRLVRTAVVVLLAALVAGACSGGSGTAGSASAAPGSPSSAPASASPAPSGSGSSGGGGAVEGNPGSGATPVPVPPIGPGDSGGTVPSPTPTRVHPVAGLLSIHDVRATGLRAAMSGDHLVAQVYWWSGPAPCSELAGVAVAHAGTTFTLTVREGAAQLGIACPALAMYKVTSVDLGAVSPGRYTVNALGVDVGAVVLYAG